MCKFVISLVDGPDVVKQAFSHLNYTVEKNNGDGVVKCIVDILFGSKKTRSGAKVLEHCEFMTRLVSQYVKDGAPIQAVVPYGTAKGYSLFSDRFGVDIGDVLAVRRLACISEQISDVYSPGVTFNIFQDNVTEAMLNTAPDTLDIAAEEYLKGLRGLFAAMALPHLFTTETALLTAIGKSDKDLRLQAEKNARLFYDYWMASQHKPREMWESLREYADLKAIGWNGPIEPETRQYYMDRVLVEHPGISTTDQITNVALYLGIALARYQFKLLRFGALSPVKVAFNGHPPGTPTAQFLGRVQYKLKDSKTSNSATPPWVGYGFVEQRGSAYEPTVVSIRHMQGIKSYKAVARLESNHHVQDFRCDVLAA